MPKMKTSDVKHPKHTSVTLGEHFQQLVYERVASGAYDSASDVIRCALRLLQQRDRKREVGWTLLGHDTFEGNFYPIDDSFPSPEEAEKEAQRRLKQDQIYIVSPDGQRRRVMPK